MPISTESWLRRPVRKSNAYTPARAVFAGDSYTPANETADGTTWRRPHEARDSRAYYHGRSDVYVYNFKYFDWFIEIFLFPQRYDKVEQPYVYQNWSSFTNPCTILSRTKQIHVPLHTLSPILPTFASAYTLTISKVLDADTQSPTPVCPIYPNLVMPCSTTSPIAMLHHITHTRNSRMTVQIRNACSILQQHITYPFETFLIFRLHNPGQLELNLNWPFNHPNCNNRWNEQYIVFDNTVLILLRK